MSQNASDVRPTRARFTVLWLLFALAVITYLDRLCISVAAPAISDEFHLTPSQMGYLFSAFTLAYALFEVPSGWLGDRFGTHSALTRIVLWWSAFTMLTGATTGFGSLLFVRLLFGAGEAGAVPNTARTISQWMPKAQQGRGLSTAFIGHSLGAAISAPLVFQLIARQGWRLTFVECGLVGVVWCGCWHRWFRNRPEEHPSVNPAELQLIQAGRTEPELATHSPRLPWKTLFGSANMALICAMYFAYAYGLYFYITWLPTYLIRARGFSTAWASFFSSLPWVVSIGAHLFGGWITDWLARRTGSLKLARCGVGAVGLAASGIALVIAARTPNNVLAASLIAVAAGFQLMTGSAAWATCLDVGRRHAGVVTGLMNTVGNLGGTIAPVVMGLIVEKLHSWTLPFYLTAIILACGVVMWLLVNPEKQLSTADSQLSMAEAGLPGNEQLTTDN